MAANKAAVLQIKTTADFVKTSKKGRRVLVSPWLSASVLQTQSELRVGWTLPRAVGSAVVRNRLKRWVRIHLSKKIKPDIYKDVVLYFRVPKDSKNLNKITHGEVDESLDSLFKKLR